MAPPTIVMMRREEASFVCVPASLNAREKIVGNMMLSPKYKAKNAMRDKVPLHTTTINVAINVRMAQARRTRFGFLEAEDQAGEHLGIHLRELHRPDLLDHVAGGCGEATSVSYLESWIQGNGTCPEWSKS